VHRLRDEVMRVFERGLPFGFPAEGEFPLINIRRDPERVTIEALAPGVVRGSLDVTAAGGRLTIRGERRAEADVPDERYHRRERETGHFVRTIKLDDRIATDQIMATYHDGILQKEAHRGPRFRGPQGGRHRCSSRSRRV